MPARIDPQIPLRGFYFFTSWLRRGGKGIRTPDLLIANETLYQLSYTPIDEHRILKLRPLKLTRARRKEAPSITKEETAKPLRTTARPKGAK